MQTSLARRERRRRNRTGAQRSGSGAGRGIAIILPLFMLGGLFGLGLVAFVGTVEVYSAYSKDLPDPRTALEGIKYNQQTVLYDRTGQIQLAAFGSENRRVLKFAEIPNVVLDTTTSTEDKTFWTNTGFDPAAVLAALRDAISGRARGASTITQQLVRKELLPPTTSTLDRKIKEIIQSVRLTQEYPGDEGKQAIITAYLNINFYGNQSYGIAAAALGYFGITDLSKLTIAQAAILAGILQAPSNYDLVANADQVDHTFVVADDAPIVLRRNTILEEMRRANADGLLRGKYNDADLVLAEQEPVILHPTDQPVMIAPQFDLMVRQQLADLLCDPGTDPADCTRVDTGGYKVITTLDVTKQKSAEKWLKAYVFGPNQPTLAADIAYLANLGITPTTDKYDYSRIIGPSSTSTVGLRNGNLHNGALIAVDYRTGQVLTYAGSADFYGDTIKDPARAGQDYFDPQFDVLSSGIGRQPGSSFKPINYLIGIQDGSLTAASLFMDVATDFGGGYIPHDADGFERGPVRLREALQYSLNIPAVKAAAINGVNHVMQRAQDFGLTFPANSDPGVSVGIGTVEVHPADLVSAYGAIADAGTLVQRTMILSITDDKGSQALTNQLPTTTHPSTPAATYVMTNILAGNTDPAQNNWWSQYKLTSGSTRRPAALKTGTSDQTEDLFAVGYVAPPSDPKAPAIVAGVWAGNSDHSPGHSVMSLEMAAPIWHAFMQDATAGTPVADFKQPDGITHAKIDAYSGMLPGPFTPPDKIIDEVFVNGTVPGQVDNTKVPTDVDTVSSTLWTYDCPGTKATNGFLDLSKVDSNNATWQKYDAIWIARAQTGVGKRGGPNNSPTMYFYETGFWTPYGATWGAPFPPTTYCTMNTGSPPPSPSETPSPSITPTPTPTSTPIPSATPAPTLPPTPTPAPTATPTPPPAPSPSATAALPLLVPPSLYRRLRGARR